MASTYSARLRLELQGDGENDSTWGQKANTVFSLVDESFGYLSKSVAGGTDVTLTANNGATDESRKRLIRLTGTITANINIIVPTAENWWFFNNETTGAFNLTVKTAAGSGVILPVADAATRWTIVRCDGTSCFRVSDLNQTLGVFGRTMMESASASAARTLLALGTAALASSGDFQPLDSDLTALAGLASAADKLPYFTGAAAAAVTTFTAFARTILDDVDAAAVRATIGTPDATDTAKGLIEIATTAETQAGTDATRAVTPSGLAASAIYQGKHTISISAGGMVPRLTNGPSSGSTETTTNKVQLRTLDFDAAIQEYAQVYIPMPKSWDEGLIDVDFEWTADSGSGVVRWGAQAVMFRDDDAYDAAFGAAVEVNDTLLAVGDRHLTSVTAITPAGVGADNNSLMVQVFRNAPAGADTLAVDARLTAIRVKYTVVAKDDA